ncbi:protein phosphatase 2C domain-containing protein [Streptomyces sp. NPDC004783]|uniref:protein phosphatase 2C domain-containing protein n=1 Tax=Streptomyces sp. NPDC004783 TaxID=3154459 RepID=UPI0033B79CAB
MSQQGGRPTGHEDDWWRELYDDSTDDTGPAAAPDSLDDRFASVSDTVAGLSDARRDGASGTREPHPPDAGAPWWTAPGPRHVPEQRDRPAPSGRSDGPGPRTGDGGGTPGTPRTPRAPEAPEDRRPPRDAPAPSPPEVTDRAGPTTPWPAPWEPPSAGPAGPVTFPPRDGPGTPAAGQPRPPVPPASPPPSARTPEAPAPPAAPSPLASSPVLPPPSPPFLPAHPPQPVPPPLPDDPVAGPRSGADGPRPTGGPPAEGAHPARTPVPDYVGSGPPTYDAEPTALPAADPDGLDGLVADTVLEGARYGTCTVRAVSVRGDSARYRGDPRRDALLVARFGAGEQALVLVATATGARGTAGTHRAAADVCRWIAGAVGRSHARLAHDLRAARRGDLKSGLHRLTDRGLGRLRADAADQGLAPHEYAATLRCLLLPAAPECRTRVFFGVGAGGLFRLRGGVWQNMEPRPGDVTGEPVVGFGSPPGDDRPTVETGIPAPPGAPAGPPREPFRFRASVARPGDVLLMCSAGLAEPLLGEPALGELLARRWSDGDPPGLAEFLADSRVRVKGYADDRTAAAVWEA